MQLYAASHRRMAPLTRRACRAPAPILRWRWRTRTYRNPSAASTPGHHACDCAARLGPVKACRADYRHAPTAYAAHGLDQPFGRAEIWLLRDGPATTDFAAPDYGVEPHELDAIVAFVQILLEWDDRERRINSQAETEGAANDDRDERIEPRGAVCARVE